jgi:hypothetical protein
MASLPALNPGDVWGSQVSTFLYVAHNTDGSLKIWTNVKDYGALCDGTTDDTTAWLAAIAAITSAGGGCLFFSGISVITQSLYFPGNCSIIGIGNNSQGSVIKVRASTGLTTPVLASAAWYDNSDYSGYPVRFSNFAIDCTASGAMSGTSAHGIVLMNYYPLLEDISVTGATGHNFLLTAHARDASHILNTCVESKFVRCESRSAGQYGFYVHDDGTGINSCTDGWMVDCISAGSAIDGMRCEMAAGWKAVGNHTYDNGRSGMYFDKCYGTRVDGNYCEYERLGSEYDACLYMGMLDSRGSSCTGNHVAFETAVGSNRRGVKLVGRGSAIAQVTCVGNTVNGGSQTGSIGFVYQAQGSQIGHTYSVSVAGNFAQNCATASYADANTTVVSNTTY